MNRNLTRKGHGFPETIPENGRKEPHSTRFYLKFGKYQKKFTKRVEAALKYAILKDEQMFILMGWSA